MSAVHQPFHENYQPQQVTNDLNILGQALKFAMDVDQAVKLQKDQEILQTLVLHEVAGPPYFANEPKLPNYREKKTTARYFWDLI